MVEEQEQRGEFHVFSCIFLLRMEEMEEDEGDLDHP